MAPPGSVPALSRRRLLQLGVLAPAALAACGGARPRADPATGTATGVPTGALDVRMFGAVGDGRTDDTAALRRAFSALRPGGALSLPAGLSFAHSEVLHVETPGVTLVGSATLVATSEGSSSLQLLADHVTVRGLTLTTPDTTHRWSAPDQHRLYLGPHEGLVVDAVTVVGSAAAGIFADGAQHFAITDVHVRDTRADGLHMTRGSAYGSVDRPTIERSGDDGVAVVSYEQDGADCHDIAVTAPTVLTTTGGRGVSVVGGHAVTYRDVRVDRSSAAAVYVACEGSPYFTFPARDVRVLGGTVTGANTDAAIDHGAALVYSGRAGGDVQDVTVQGLQVSGTRDGASRQIGVVVDGGGQVSGVTFDDLQLAGEPTPYQGDAPLSAIHLQAVTAAGRAVRA